MGGAREHETPKWTIISTGLHNFTGHEYWYTKSVLDRLDRQRYKVSVWGRKDATAVVRSEAWFRPVFSRIHYDQSADGVISLLRSLIKRERVWYKELAGTIKDEQWREGDIVFVHTFSVYSIWQWWRVQDWFERKRINLFLLLRYSPTIVPRYLRPIYSYLYRRLAVGRKYVHLLTDSEQLENEYRALSLQPMHVVAIPVEHKWFANACANPDDDSRVVIGYLGSARNNKGFNLLPGVIAKVNRSVCPDGLLFRIQCTISGTDCYEAECTAALRELRRLQTVWRNIELIDSSLGPGEYSAFLESMHVVLLPYVGSEYRTQTSGTLAEALACGKQCIVPRGTWLAHQIEEIGSGETFEAGDEAELAVKIEKAVEKYKRGERCPTEKQKWWISKHNPENLVAKIGDLCN